MKRNYWITLLLASGCLLTSCMRQDLTPGDPFLPQENQSKSLVPGKAIVLLSEDYADDFAIENYPDVAARLGVVSADRLFPDAGEFEAKHRAAGLHRWYRISYDPDLSITKAQADLRTLPGVELVEIPRKTKRQAFFNDMFLPMQWHLTNTGALGPAFKPGLDINVEPVWREFTAGSSDVIVAIIDTGVDILHPDLAGAILAPGPSGSRNFHSDYGIYEIPACEHGTHVAGIIGAINNNGIYCSGIAGGYYGEGGVRLMSCVIDDEKAEVFTDFNEPLALVWAADNGAVIANNSWGDIYDSEEEAAEGVRSFLNGKSSIKAAIDYFIENAGTDAKGNQTGPMKGGLVVFAVGNDGWAHASPAEYSKVVAVGAVGPDGKMAAYSNYGPWVDILAPGGSDSEDPKEWIASLFPDERAVYLCGTSMACPQVAGVAALLVSYFGGPGFTVDELKECLLNGARPDVIDLLGRPVGGGMLDAYGSFMYRNGTVSPAQDGIRIIPHHAGEYRIKSHETLVADFTIKGNEGRNLPVSLESDCPGARLSSISASRAEMTVNALRAEPGKYTATIRVGNVASRTVSIEILENHVPQVSEKMLDIVINAQSKATTKVSLAGCFEDSDNEPLYYSVSVSPDWVVSSLLVDNDIIVLSPLGFGQAEVTVTASDARRTSCSTSFQVLSRDTALDLDVFPNPVHDFLNVRPGTEASPKVFLYDRNGACVFSQEKSAGPFSPIQLDVRGLPAGNYSLQVEMDAQRYITSIVKY